MPPFAAYAEIESIYMDTIQMIAKMRKPLKPERRFPLEQAFQDPTVVGLEDKQREQAGSGALRDDLSYIPASGLSWFDVAAYCNWMTEQERLARRSVVLRTKRGEYAVRQAQAKLFTLGRLSPTDCERVAKGLRMFPAGLGVFASVFVKLFPNVVSRAYRVFVK